MAAKKNHPVFKYRMAAGFFQKGFAAQAMMLSSRWKLWRMFSMG